MTEECKRIQKQFVEAFYQELPLRDRADFEEHLKRCPTCSDRFAEMKRTLQLMSRRERPPLSADFWEDLEAGIHERIGEEKERERHRRRSWTWVYRIAAAIILVLLGIGIDRVFWHPAQPPDSSGLPLIAARSDLEVQLTHFLGRSQLLLLALANVDTLADGAETIDLTVQKRVSRELFEEANQLTASLREEGHYRLAGLVGDLEKVLLQVANLEERRGLRQVRLIQRSVQESDLLLRVNLQKLRPSLDRKTDRPSSERMMG